MTSFGVASVKEFDDGEEHAVMTKMNDVARSVRMNFMRCLRG